MSNTSDRSRLDSEWLLVNAVREVIRLASEGDSRKSTYEQALKLGAEICPQILGEDVSLLRRHHESATAREFRQKAEAMQTVSGEEISPVDLLKEEIAEYEGLVSKTRNQQKTESLKRRLEDMKRAQIEIDPSRHTENQIIFRDAYNVERDLPEIATGQSYRDFKLSDDEFLRLRVLHPDNPEHVTGADLLYEKHHPVDKKVNIAAVQYKLWEDKSMHLNDSRMKKQLERMSKFFCDNDLCVAGSDDHSYRFPYCAAFLRPTDRLQSADQKLASTGEHVPVCRIEELKSLGAKGGECLTYDRIRSVSLSHEVFEGLFSTGKVGSRTLTYTELENVYKDIKEFRNRDHIVIHAQDFAQSFGKQGAFIEP